MMTSLYNVLIQNIVVILGVLGALAFALELIVQLTKELPGIKRIPTKLYVIIVSLIVCVTSLFIYLSYSSTPVMWYYVVLAVFAAFVTAYIAIYGWDTFKDLYTRIAKGGSIIAESTKSNDVTTAMQEPTNDTSQV